MTDSPQPCAQCGADATGGRLWARKEAIATAKTIKEMLRDPERLCKKCDDARSAEPPATEADF